MRGPKETAAAKFIKVRIMFVRYFVSNIVFQLIKKLMEDEDKTTTNENNITTEESNNQLIDSFTKSIIELKDQGLDVNEEACIHHLIANQQNLYIQSMIDLGKLGFKKP